MGLFTLSVLLIIMKVLIVCSGNFGRINPFISDHQAASLNRAEAGIITDFFSS